jgi:preprotein translocase subunit SecY
MSVIRIPEIRRRIVFTVLLLIDRTTATFCFGGTSLLIVIGVALDTVRQAQAQAVIRNYRGYLKQAA